jgi:hypothetical protein
VSRNAVPQCTPRSNQVIERIAEDFLRSYYPTYLIRPGAVPVDRFVEFVVPKEAGIIFGVQDWPAPIEGSVLPGMGNRPGQLLLSTWVYDGLLNGGVRERFTAAHEGGHGILHARELTAQLVEGGIRLNRRSELRPYVDPEHQANVFAAAFLMNANAVRVSFRESRGDVAHMARVFGVSFTAMRIRLESLGLLLR